VATVGAAIAWSLRDRAKPAADADEPGRVSPASPRG
jgi:hypothetical protein